MDSDCCFFRVRALVASGEDGEVRFGGSRATSSFGYLVGSRVRRSSVDGIFLRRTASQRWIWIWGCSVFFSGEDGQRAEMGSPDEGAESKGDSIESFTDSASSETTSSVESRPSSSDIPLPGWSLALDPRGKNPDLPCVEAAKPKQGSALSEMEMMKERFSKLLLGEDMSGGGKGVCAALSISNAITNLCGTVFGQIWRLEPLSPEKKALWRREMDWLLCVSDHIVELIPAVQTFPDGTKREFMSPRPRSDLVINLPALRKLDAMLLDILDEFGADGFKYADRGIVGDSAGAAGRTLRRQDGKWWLPVPCVPAGGLPESTRKKLRHKRDCTGQILKAAMAINSNTLAKMDVPQPYLHSLPRTARAALGDVLYRCLTSDQFSPDRLLDHLDLSSEHRALEVANRVEASVFVWRGRVQAPPPRPSSARWATERRELLAERAEGLLFCLKQRFPCLTQTTLDTTKIQCNKDVGKSILESYSRVLESLAFNVVARIDDVLCADDMAKNKSNKLSPGQCRALVPISNTISHTAAADFSPARSSCSPACGGGGGRTPFLPRKAAPPAHGRGFGVKKALTDYLGVHSMR